MAQRAVMRKAGSEELSAAGWGAAVVGIGVADGWVFGAGEEVSAWGAGTAESGGGWTAA